MPIIEPAPWRHQYFSHIPCPAHVVIPTDDPEAWVENPRHRWVFDKLQVALSQGLAAGPHGLAPPTYPVFSKPIMNFKGMGLGSRVIRSAEEMAATYEPGHMWMQLLTGPHVSTDLAIVDGRVAWSRQATGLPTQGGMFDYWTVHGGGDAELSARLEAWVRANLAGYTGMLNTETIGGTIIEAHLRFADQWPDLYGTGWVEALVGLYQEGVWRYPDHDRREGYSLALFMPHGRRFRHPPGQLVDNVCAAPGISSVQITFYEEKPPEHHANPPGGFRVALINAWDLRAGTEQRERLGDWFRSFGDITDQASGNAITRAR